MTNPLVATIDKKSSPRALFFGDQLIEVDLPVGSRVIYPRKPLAALPNADSAIRYAIDHPENSPPLHALLSPGMKVVIAIDDISLPLPPMRAPDIRERVLKIVLATLREYGVTDYEMIIATAIHRRMTADEIKHIVGDDIFRAHYPHRLYNHDAEDRKNMVEIASTKNAAKGADGKEESSVEPIEINRKAAESDLIIYVNINLVPMDGGHKSVTVGLTSYRSLRAHHNPRVMRDCHSYMDPSKSALADVVNRMGRELQKHKKVFAIETVVNNRMFDKPLSFLAKNEDDLTLIEKTALKALVGTLKSLPQPARHKIFDSVPSPYELIAVHAGDTEAVHQKTIAKCMEQYLVPVQGQADVLVMGIPFISPYNVHAFLNPLLVSVLAQGYLFNLYRGVPLVKKGGTLIITHPCTDKFDKAQHPAYIEFVHKILPQTRDAIEMHKKFEESFVDNPAYIEMYRRGHAYHPAHPFFMWYWGETGRQWTNRVIVVGADNEYIPKLLGYETARTMDEALHMARQVHPSMSVTCFHTPPILMADCTA